jgi:hypothetical protein
MLSIHEPISHWPLLVVPLRIPWFSTWIISLRITACMFPHFLEDAKICFTKAHKHHSYKFSIPPALSTFSVPLCKARPYPHRVNPGMQPEEKAWQNLVHNLKARWLCPNIQSVIHQEVGNHNKLDLYVTIWPYAGQKNSYQYPPRFLDLQKTGSPLRT